jgi:hypothetical protein
LLFSPASTNCWTEKKTNNTADKHTIRNNAQPFVNLSIYHRLVAIECSLVSDWQTQLSAWRLAEQCVFAINAEHLYVGYLAAAPVEPS